MSLTVFLKKPLFRDIIGWCILLLFIGLTVYYSYDSQGENIGSEAPAITLILWGSIIAASYLSLFLHRVFFERAKYFLYGLTYLGGATVIAFVFRFTGELVVEGGFAQSASSDVINFIFIMGLALGIRYAKRGLLDQYHLQKTQALLLKSELETLKSQLNPHFLFNSLNNIYGVNLSDSKKGSEMIIHLAELYRYFLDIQKKDWVSLKDELAFLNHYVELEKLRLTENNHIHYTINIDDENTKVAPLLLLPIIENAIKFGTFPGGQSVVDIQIRCNSGYLSLSTHNRYQSGRNIVSSGYGIQNLKQRLSLLYPGRFVLQSEPKDTLWFASLEINL
jgi:two-component system LytT family sensor kinase